MKLARTNDLHNKMGKQSAILQQLLREAGYGRGNGVSAAGCQLVTRLAREKNLRDWPATRTPEDYEALIVAVAEHLNKAQ